MDAGAWLIPDLSLATQASMEIDRRRAAHLGIEELAALADTLICDWYRQRQIIDSALGRVRHLEVEVALLKCPPARREPEPQHWRWAKELLRETR